MDGNNSMDVNFTDLDLNQQPSDPPVFGRVARFGSLLNDLETAHERVEERIRQLEAVTARARQRQRWRDANNSMETSSFSDETMVDVGVSGNNSTGSEQRSAPYKGIGYKRDSSHLVAKALKDSEVKKADKESGSFYDCNICLELATEPVLTCCGHLFCWACFYQVSYIDPNTKECPVCKGEVSDGTVTPIYGNGGCERVQQTESGLKIPPRPKAQRLESARQQRVARGLSHVPVAEALRRIRISIGEIGDQRRQQEGGSGNINIGTVAHEEQNADPAAGNHRIRIHQVSRVLSESAASLSSLSSALSNAERLVEDLETVISNRFLGNNTQAPSHGLENLLTRSSAVLQSNQALDPIANTNAHVSSSVANVEPGSSSGGTSVPVVPSSSLRRRRIVPRTTAFNNRDSREISGRRLN